MKVQSVSASTVNPYTRKTNKSLNTSVATLAERSSSISSGAFVISFSGAKKQDSVIFLGAECPPLCKVGGVATVMNDYKSFNPVVDGSAKINERIIVIPYYNGANTFDKTGDNIENTGIHHHNGKYWYTNADLSTRSFADAFEKNNGAFFEVKVVKNSSMSWGKDADSKISLLKVVGQKDKNGEVKSIADKIYMVYTDATAKMSKPYDDGSYSSAVSPLKGANVGDWQGDAYAKFNRAFVKLLPDSGLDSAHLVLSDSQTAYVPEYMAQELKNGKDFYRGIKNTYIAHNLGSGYIGHTSMQNMFVNLGATPEEIDAVLNDDNFYKYANTNKYFVDKGLVDGKLALNAGHTSPTKLLMAHLKDDYVNKMITVSEGYADSVASNSRVSEELQADFKKLFDEKKFVGVLNVLNDPNMTFNKPVGIPGYKNTLTREVKLSDGSQITKTFEPIKAFTFGIDGIEKMTQADAAKAIKENILDKENGMNKFLDHIKETKAYNRARVLERFTGEFVDDGELLAGLGNKKVNLIGYIDKKYVDAPDTKLFTSWGRGDFQKGLDTAFDAFKKFVDVTNDEKSVFLFGGELPESGEEATKIKMLMNNLPDKLRGRVAFLSGFAPNGPFASAADATIFPSRFAPCELTDLESMKYFASPIVAGTQGLKQKNFDPRIDSEKDLATGYKTQTEFYEPYDSLKKKAPSLNEFLNKKEEELVATYVNRGLDANDASEKAKNLLYQQKSVQDEVRRITDDLVSTELAEAMQKRVNQSDDLTFTMWKNHMNIDTTWMGNAILHPDKTKPTSIAYFDSMIGNVTENPNVYKKDASSFVKSIYSKLNNGKDVIDPLPPPPKPFGKGKIALISAAVVAAGAGVYYFLNKNNNALNVASAYQNVNNSKKKTENNLSSRYQQQLKLNA